MVGIFKSSVECFFWYFFCFLRRKSFLCALLIRMQLDGKHVVYIQDFAQKRQFILPSFSLRVRKNLIRKFSDEFSKRSTLRCHRWTSRMHSQPQLSKGIIIRIIPAQQIGNISCRSEEHTSELQSRGH